MLSKDIFFKKDLQLHILILKAKYMSEGEIKIARIVIFPHIESDCEILIGEKISYLTPTK